MKRRTGWVLLTATAAALVGLGNTTALAATSVSTTASRLAAHTAAHPSGAGQYVTIRPVCAQAHSVRYATCLALRRVDVVKGTPGALALARPSAGSGPAGGFTPGQLAKAYGVNAGAATTQTVAIVDAHDDPFALSELNTFNKRYRLPKETATSFRKLNQNGKAAPLPSLDTGWAGEIALDLQSVRGLCHRCKIILIEAKDASFANLGAAVNTAVKLGAKIVSNSYGGPEAGGTPTVQKFYNHPGVAILASAGDHGWYDFDLANEITGVPRTTGASANMPNTPAAFPSVVAVGGTTLRVGSSGARTSESVWNHNGLDDRNGINNGSPIGSQGATGSGCSLRFAAPAWQKAATGYSALGCKGERSVADIGALADPSTGYDIYSHYNGGWATFGGTSLSSPLVAAMWALAGGPKGVKYPAQTLYHNYATKRAATLYDVVKGGSSFCGGDTKAHCSRYLKNETNPPTGNPNNIANGSNQHNGEGHGAGWAGLLDCGYPYSGRAGLIAEDNQCYAAAGLDGPSGIGTPKGLGVFKP